MNSSDTPSAAPAPSAHVLARELATRLTTNPERPAHVLFLGIGSGRNLAPFLAAGLRIDALDDDEERVRTARARFASEPRVRTIGGRYDDALPSRTPYDGALSTHALLHGDERTVGGALAATHACLRAGAPLYATFGSTNDPRFGTGVRIDDTSYAPHDGPEAGVAHVYFDERRLRAILAGFTIESMIETAAAEHVGRWAHDETDASTIVHWFVRATARVPQ